MVNGISSNSLLTDENKARISFYELLSIVFNYIAPRGNAKLRLRLAGLISALLLSKLCAAIIPIFYGASVDAVSQFDIESGLNFSMGLLILS